MYWEHDRSPVLVSLKMIANRKGKILFKEGVIVL